VPPWGGMNGLNPIRPDPPHCHRHSRRIRRPLDPRHPQPLLLPRYHQIHHDPRSRYRPHPLYCHRGHLLSRVICIRQPL